MDVLPGSPILTPTGAARLLGRSFRAANQAIAALTEAEILRQVTVGRRNRAFEAIDVIDAFTDFERQLGSPRGTRSQVRLLDRFPIGHREESSELHRVARYMAQEAP